MNWRLQFGPTARDRRNAYALFIGIGGAAVTWLAAQLSPGEYLCIERSTLIRVGVGMAGLARLLGILFAFEWKRGKHERRLRRRPWSRD